MTKNQFMKALRNKLRFRVSPEELSDIMMDMAECFEAGAADGRTEEAISAGLGSPKELAEKLSTGKKISAAHIIKPAVCISVFILIHFLILKTEAELFVPLIFLPPVFLLICESPKKALQSITEYPADFIIVISAALLPVSGIFMQAFFRNVLVESAHKIAGSAIIIFMTAAIISNMLLLISSIKSHKLFNSIISSAVIIFSVFTLIKQIAVMAKYPAYENVMGELGIVKQLFEVLLFTSLCSAICTLSEKNALRTAALYPPLFTIAFGAELRRFISRIDPSDTNFDFMSAMRFEYYLYGGLICSAAVLAVIMLLRRRAANG